jgi:DNA-binding CsgD family transcriptional regulator/tetratricopeptide (TPR) repeat protein
VAGWDTGAVLGHGVSNRTFVGRRDELKVLDEAFEAAVAGEAAAVLVGGDAGIGKSRLLDEACGRLRARGALAVTGVCAPIDGGLPYGPVVGILRDVARQLGSDQAADALGPLAGGLAPLAAGLEAGAPIGAERHTEGLAKTRLFESLLSGFTALAERSPLVLVFDDLQWADSASAELLSFLVRNLADAPVLLVGAYRSEEVGPDHELRPWLAELSRHARVVHLRLDGLGHDELGRLIGDLLGHEPDWTVVEAVWARSQGNPFFAEELTNAGPSPSLPPELQRVILTRVEALSKKAQQLLRIAAVAGFTAPHRLLAAVADGFDADALDAALAEAVDRQILVVDDSRAGYCFRHALLREAVETSLLPGERARLHRQVATALVADLSLASVDGVHELATHWWEAGEWAEALAASVAAADAAVAVWAYPEAYRDLERALAALERVPADTPVQFDPLELMERTADVAYLVGEAARSVELIKAAIDGTDVGRDPALAARRYAMFGRNAWALGDTTAAFGAYEQAAALLPADPPSADLARVMAEEARSLMLMARFGDAERRGREAIAAARAVGARAEEGHALYTLGCARGCLGHDEEAFALIREALAIAEELASPDDLNRAYMGLSNFLVDFGRLEEGAALVFDSAAMGEALWGVRLNGAAGNSTEALFRLGRYDDADALLAQTGDRGIGTCMTQPSLLRTELAIRRGRLEEAARALAIADETSVGLDDVQQRGWFHMVAAELAMAEGRADVAWEEVERALAIAAGTEDETYLPEMCALGVRALADRVEDAQLRGLSVEVDVDVDKASLLAHGLVEEVERVVAAPAARGGRCAPRVLAFAAMCAAEESRLSTSDPALWDEAARRWEAAGEPYPVAYCRWRSAAAVLAGKAGRGAAADSLQSAWEVSVHIGALPLREQIEGLARRARIELSDVGDEQPSAGSTLASDLGITPREVEVLGQLAAGRTDKEIADALFISKKTASVHVSNLLRKLDVANRVEAGRIGQAHGLG